ncbi:MAG: DMT family transporter [bacterium]|nr:DMT family transporter [bacterium]
MDFLNTAPPNLLAFGTAVLIAVALVFYRDALSHMSVIAATVCVNLIISVGGALLVFFSRGPIPWTGTGIFWFALVGVFGPFMGRYFQYHSISYIGLARTNVLSQTMPAWSAVFAVVFLGEDIRAGVGLGTALILSGAVLLVQERVAAAAKVPLRYYLVGLLAPLSLSFTPALRKLGFLATPSVPAGLVVAMLTGTVVQLLYWRLLRPDEAWKWSKRSIVSVVMGGVVNLFAALCFWTAIKTGELVSVVPITRLSVLFVLAFAWLFFRKQERLTWRVVAGGMISLAGAVAIAVSK